MSSICDNQNDFNTAVKTAIDNYVHEKDHPSKKSVTIVILYSIAIFFFLIWAVYLVSQEKKNDERIVSFVYAIILSPVYVLSYYLNEIF